MSVGNMSKAAIYIKNPKNTAAFGGKLI